MKYRKKPVVIEATQWFKNGDHPEDDSTRGGTTTNGEYWEGKIVRYFHRPDIPADELCNKCGHFMELHGWIDTAGGGHVVCPGDYIITKVNGEMYPCKSDIFESTYEEVS